MAMVKNLMAMVKNLMANAYGYVYGTVAIAIKNDIFELFFEATAKIYPVDIITFQCSQKLFPSNDISWLACQPFYF